MQNYNRNLHHNKKQALKLSKWMFLLNVIKKKQNKTTNNKSTLKKTNKT